MFYAKSNPEESIREHTDKLVNNYYLLKNTYGELIEKHTDIESKVFWKLLLVAVKYHDLGKAFTPFQNMIKEKLDLKTIETDLENNIPHNYLSPAFLPFKDLEIDKQYRKALTQAIGYHHERDKEIDVDLIEKVIKEDLQKNKEELEVEMDLKFRKKLSVKYIKNLLTQYRIKEDDEEYYLYILLKGLLHRLDHSASAHLEIEDDTKQGAGESTFTYINEHFNGNLRDVQKFSKENKENNLLIIASTGMGKTESALLWIDDSKAFFTLPLRVSINALFKRVIEEIGYSHTGLLHSTSRDYLEDQEYQNSIEIYEQSKILSAKLNFTTIDQIFNFPFRFRGYEKIYATLAYSKVVIDEIQAYSPRIAAVILKGIEMINNIGGKFMIMTATLPRIYIDYLDKRGIEFKKDTFLLEKERHKICVEDKVIDDAVAEIIAKGKNKKVIVIVNTVKKALELYEKVEKSVDYDEVYLLHSMFTQADRARLEGKIKEFADSEALNRGVWITTQIVEASLDVDFDYLFTELSTLDSLFQRLGRCYRKRKFDLEEPNIYIYTEKVTGVGSIYDKDIFNLSKTAIKNYDREILKENVKVELVDSIYSKEKLAGTEFLKEFQKALEILDNLGNYDLNKSEAQKILRDIDSKRVIPKELYDQNIDIFENYNLAQTKEEKLKLIRKINNITINVPSYKVRENLYPLDDLKGLFVLDVKYSPVKGLMFEERTDNFI